MIRRGMKGDTTADERYAHWLGRVSTRQRVLVLTFPTIADAERFDKMTGEEVLQALLAAPPPRRPRPVKGTE